MMSMHEWSRRVVVCLAAASFLVACSDDESTRCDPDERLNELTGECELAASNGGGARDRSGNNHNNAPPVGDDDAGNQDNNGDDDAGDNGSERDADNQDAPDGDDQHEDDVGGCGPGAVIGQACDTTGKQLSGAEITIEGTDCDGEPFTVTAESDYQGNFEFDEVPGGQHTLHVSSGSFSDRQTIIVRPGQTLELDSSSKACLKGGDVDIAIIEGEFDHVEGILDNLELDYETFGGDYVDAYGMPNNQAVDDAADFLSDDQQVQNRDIIFINCGNLWPVLEQTASDELAQIVSNLKAFVDSGKSLYVSDLAHPFIENIYSEAIDFYGDDSDLQQARKGYAPQTVDADVTSSEMQSLLGGGDATIDFPHDPANGVYNTNWAVAEDVGDSSIAHIVGDATLCQDPDPYTDDSCPGAGTTQPGVPLLVSHEAANNGTAIFTAFHNKSQGDVLNEDMEEILRFLIFQL